MAWVDSPFCGSESKRALRCEPLVDLMPLVLSACSKLCCTLADERLLRHLPAVAAKRAEVAAAQLLLQEEQAAAESAQRARTRAASKRGKKARQKQRKQVRSCDGSLWVLHGDIARPVVSHCQT